MEDFEEDMWDKLLSPMAQLKLAASKAARSAAGGQRLDGWAGVDAEQVTKLLQLTDEMRDRLRYSQQRMAGLKSELAYVRDQSAADLAAMQQRAAADLAAAQQAAASEVMMAQQAAAAQVAGAQQQASRLVQQMEQERAKERDQAEARLAAFQSELTRLNQEVVGQAAALDARVEESRTLRCELATARQAQGAVHAEAQGKERQLAQAQAERASLLKEIKQLRTVALEAEQRSGEAERRSAKAEAKLVHLTQGLVSNKARMAELHQVEGLYMAAREEIVRLEKENGELKDMISQGRGGALSRSRILEAVAPCRCKSVPLHLTPEVQGKRRSAVTGRKASPGSDPQRHMGRISVARDVLFEYDDGLLAHPVSPGRAANVSPTRSRPMSAGPPLACKALPDLAWLGPPTSAYPPDPDQFEYLRVAGGYQPKWVGTKETPKASGWVPKDVVRVVQAFKHAYGIEGPDWRFWEPLLLLVDEIYASKANKKMAGARAASAGRVHAARREAKAAADYPAPVQAARIAYLKRQLEALRKGMAAQERRDDSTMRHMAEKEYHLINQLDEAVDRNAALRKSFQDLDELYGQEAETIGAYRPS